MDTIAQRVEKIADTVLRPLVDYPEEFELTTSELEDETILVEVRVNPEDAGKVIGRQGRVIKSVRTLVRAVASRENRRVEVELVEE